MNYTPRALHAALACAVASAALTVGPVWADSAVPSAPASATELTATQAETLQTSAASGDKLALQTLMVQAQKGNPYAQFNLGFLYQIGHGVVPQDYAQAAQWYRKAADQGNAMAQCSLGDIYAEGLGVPQDGAQAALWYRKAAEQENVFAQIGLGLLYQKGQGVPQDYAQAAQWFRKVAEQTAEQIAKRTTEQGAGHDAAQGARKAIAFAQYNLGMFYANGQGVTQDYVQAAQWFRKSAEGGDTDAQTNLGVFYLQGQGVPQDYAQAMQWWRKAAAQGNTAALNKLGIQYYLGQGVPQNSIVAYALRNLAATPNGFPMISDARPTVPPAPGMTAQDIEAGNALFREMARPGNLLKALDHYLATGQP